MKILLQLMIIFLMLTLCLMVSCSDDDYNPTITKIYYTNTNPYELRSANLDGDGTAVTLVTGSTSFKGVAIDKINGKIYYTDNSSSDGGIYIYDLKTGGTPQKLSDIERTWGIALDVENNKIYYGTAESPYQLMSADLDGGGKQTLVSDTKSSCKDIAIDKVNGKIYYTGNTSSNAGIHIYDLNAGGSPQTIITDRTYSIALDVANNKMYYTTAEDPRNLMVNNLDASETSQSVCNNPFSSSLRGVVIDKVNGKIYFSDTSSSGLTIYKVDLGSVGATAVPLFTNVKAEAIALSF